MVFPQPTRCLRFTHTGFGKSSDWHHGEAWHPMRWQNMANVSHTNGEPRHVSARPYGPILPSLRSLGS